MSIALLNTVPVFSPLQVQLRLHFLWSWHNAVIVSWICNEENLDFDMFDYWLTKHLNWVMS